MESQQLLTQGQVFQDEVLPGAKDGKNPAEQKSQAPKHDRILAECTPRRQAPKSLILQRRGIMANQRRKLQRILQILGVSYVTFS